MDATRESHELLSVEQVLCRHCILGDLGYRSSNSSQLRWHRLIFRRFVHLQSLVFFAKHVGQSEELELILLWWWRSTQRCIHNLVCLHYSLSNPGTVGHQRFQRWLHVPHNLVLEYLICWNQWSNPLQEITSTITIGVKPSHRTTDGLTEDVVFSLGATSSSPCWPISIIWSMSAGSRWIIGGSRVKTVGRAQSEAGELLPWGSCDDCCLCPVCVAKHKQ